MDDSSRRSMPKEYKRHSTLYLAEVKELTSKIKAIAIALVVATVAGLLVYAPLTLAGSRNNSRKSETDQPMPMQLQTIMNSDTMPRGYVLRFRRELLRRFLANSTAVEVQGTVVARVNKMLVLNTVEGQVRVHLSPKWTVNGQVQEIEGLFETNYLVVGQNITIEALKGTLVTKDTYSIYLLFGYEMINAGNVHAYAVLPFNIATP